MWTLKSWCRQQTSKDTFVVAIAADSEGAQVADLFADGVRNSGHWRQNQEWGPNWCCATKYLVLWHYFRDATCLWEQLADGCCRLSCERPAASCSDVRLGHFLSGPIRSGVSLIGHSPVLWENKDFRTKQCSGWLDSSCLSCSLLRNSTLCGF